MATILIVEDEPIVAQEMTLTLADAGHQVVGIANDEATAVKHAAAVNPELVLMDIKLANNSDGIDTAKLIRAHSPVPVVFVSAGLDRNTRQRAAAANPVGYLVKPYFTGRRWPAWSRPWGIRRTGQRPWRWSAR